jgi:hypothetical protein
MAMVASVVKTVARAAVVCSMRAAVRAIRALLAFMLL